MTAITIQSDEHWAALRALNVGGTEVPALFGEHEHGLTRFELWHTKAPPAKPYAPRKQTERMKAGTYMEPAIGKWVADETGWTIRKVRRYHSLLPDFGLGGTIDYEIVSNERGPGILEIKTADWLVAKAWENGTPPLSYMLQVQSYLAITGRAWGCIAVLVGGNDLRLFPIERREVTIDLIKNEVAKFWLSIADNKPPPPDFARDGATLARLYSAVAASKVVDMSDSNRLHELIAGYQIAARSTNEHATLKAAAKAEMLTLIGDAEKVICGNATISAKTVAGTDIAYRRADYRDFRITQKGAGKTDA